MAIVLTTALHSSMDVNNNHERAVLKYKSEEEILDDIAKEFVSEFKEEWRPSIEAMETAEEIFGKSKEKANLLENLHTKHLHNTKVRS